MTTNETSAMAEKQPVENRRIDELVELIQDLGYRAKQFSPVSISTAMSGYTTLVFHHPGHSVQMYTGFSKEDDSKFNLDTANSFNKDNRFAKCYLTEKGVRFEGDFFFDIDHDGASETLKRIFQSWEASLGSVTETYKNLAS